MRLRNVRRFYVSSHLQVWSRLIQFSPISLRTCRGMHNISSSQRGTPNGEEPKANSSCQDVFFSCFFVVFRLLAFMIPWILDILLDLCFCSSVTALFGVISCRSTSFENMTTGFIASSMGMFSRFQVVWCFRSQNSHGPLQIYGAGAVRPAAGLVRDGLAEGAAFASLQAVEVRSSSAKGSGGSNWMIYCLVLSFTFCILFPFGRDLFL